MQNLEQFGQQLTNCTGESIGDQETTFLIYERDGKYTVICFIDNTFYSQPFDHAPADYEVEAHFQADERLKKHYRDSTLNQE